MLGVVPFEVFDGSEGLSIDQVPQVALVSQSTTLQIVVAAAQGPAGPSSIAAAQVSDSGATGRALMKAADAASARAALSVAAVGRKAVADANYAAQAADVFVAFTGLTAPRTVTLPLASTYQPGQALWIADETGLCGTDKPIIVAAAGSDTIGNQPNVTMQSPFQKLALHSNGSGLWTV